MNIVAMVRTFLSMPGCINPALLSFLWTQESDKKSAGERIRTAVEMYAAGISKDDQDAWMGFVIQMVQLDKLLGGVGLVDLAKDKICEVYAEVFDGMEASLDWAADWITKLTEIELGKQPGNKEEE